MQIIVKEVSNNKEFKIFYQFQNKLYKECKEYVPSLDADQKESLSNNPALEYCTRKMWLAYSDNRPVGRVMAIINPRYNDYYKTRYMRFGWLDFEEDFEIAKSLMDKVVEWGKLNGMDHIHGPLAYNTLGRQGMLVEGFENTPPTNCLYNYPYYVDYMEQLGFEKEADWVQYKLKATQGAPEKLERISKLLIERYKLHMLNISKMNKEERSVLIDKFFKIYNECFTAVHNFIPLTPNEIKETGEMYFKLLRPELNCIVMDEKDDIAAFGLCMPSLSEAFKKANGRLFPFGWYHILRGFKRYDTIDLMMVGSNPAWQSKGLSAIYHSKLAENFKKFNISTAITNPQIDTNTAAVKVWESYDKEPFMRRRCWIKKIK